MDLSITGKNNTKCEGGKIILNSSRSSTLEWIKLDLEFGLLRGQYNLYFQ